MAVKKIFSEKDINTDPFIQFDRWYKERLGAGIEVPDAAILGTSTPSGKVSVRVVLLKEYNENGFVFFTNYKSRKAHQLMSNHHAAFVFYWPESGRQIRIEGITVKVSEEESDEYFKTRPRESQISAWASEQSSVIHGRSGLEKQFKIYASVFEGKSVPRPDHWGGFRLIPSWFEFWQEGDFRLHDRLTYTKKENRWLIKRLSP